MLIFRFVVSFWVTSRVGLHALTFKKHIVILSNCCITVFPFSLKGMLYFWPYHGFIERTASEMTGNGMKERGG